MKVLVLGGTHFIGRTLVERLQKHDPLEIILFNRGVSNPNLFPNLRTIIGDRNNEDELKQLFKEKWDVVIDCSGYFPKSVRQLIVGLNRDLIKYIYVSSCSVYDHYRLKGEMREEGAPNHICNSNEENDTSTSTYGKRKAACEQTLKSSGIPFVIFRPALVFGPYDQTDRFYYWLHQIKTKTRILLPESGKRRFSMTYVHDLVEAIVEATLQEDFIGVFNAVSYPATSLKEVVEIGSEILGTNPEFVHASYSYLHQNDVAEWVDLPLWLNSDEYTYTNRKLLETIHLKPTSLNEAITRTIQYYNSIGFHIPTAGMGNEQQQSLIKVLKNDR